MTSSFSSEHSPLLFDVFSYQVQAETWVSKCLKHLVVSFKLYERKLLLDDLSAMFYKGR